MACAVCQTAGGTQREETLEEIDHPTEHDYASGELAMDWQPDGVGVVPAHELTGQHRVSVSAPDTNRGDARSNPARAESSRATRYRFAQQDKPDHLSRSDFGMATERTHHHPGRP